MNAYSESADFHEKKVFFDFMLRRLEELGVNLSLKSQTFENALEIGGSGGVLASYVKRDIARNVFCTDIVDVNALADGCFIKLVNEKMIRNNVNIDISKIYFHKSDAQYLIYRDSFFDFVYSQNTFEHIPNPKSAFQEVLRVLKNGAPFYLKFDPVWTADTGSHFQKYLKDPWVHLLMSDDEMVATLRNSGASSYECNAILHEMNRHPISYYRESIKSTFEDNCKYYSVNYINGVSEISNLNHTNVNKVLDMLKIEKDDLFVRAVEIYGIK